MTDPNIYTNQILNPNLRATCEKLADYPDFWTHPASTGIHHGHLDGLWIHTKEVLDFALHQAKLFPAINKDILIAAALWHDLGKIWDYKLVTYYKHQYDKIPEYNVFHSESEEKDEIYQNGSLVAKIPSWKKVYIADKDYKNQIHHITGSTAEFTLNAANCGVDRKTIQAVQHAIIGHHGRRDWGSIKEPQTLEAMILHHADNLSAKFGPRKDK